jgi:hypothetical protein
VGSEAEGDKGQHTNEFFDLPSFGSSDAARRTYIGRMVWLASGGDRLLFVYPLRTGSLILFTELFAIVIPTSQKILKYRRN